MKAPLGPSSASHPTFSTTGCATERFPGRYSPAISNVLFRDPLVQTRLASAVCPGICTVDQIASGKEETLDLASPTSTKDHPSSPCIQDNAFRVSKKDFFSRSINRFILLFQK